MVVPGSMRSGGTATTLVSHTAHHHEVRAPDHYHVLERHPVRAVHHGLAFRLGRRSSPDRSVATPNRRASRVSGTPALNARLIAFTWATVNVAGLRLASARKTGGALGTRALQGGPSGSHSAS